MLSSLAPARRRVVLAAISAVVLAVAAVVIVIAARSLGGTDSTAAAVPSGSLGPVVLVPGYGGSTSSLDDLAATLERQGKTVEVLHVPGNGTGDLLGQARALAAAARSLLARGAESIDVVGYSAGGVVARLWVRDLGGATLARRVITLGSPHHGTDLAGLAGSLVPSECPTACHQLEPNSPLLTALNDGDETPDGPTFVSIWTTRDNVVVPASSAQLAGALNMTVQSVCPSDVVDHSGLPRDRAVQAMVSAELAAGGPVPLGPAALGPAACPRT